MSPQPRRWVVLDQPVPSPANDLSANFDDATRRGDVIGEILRATALPNGMGRGEKLATNDAEERASILLRERRMALLVGLIEIGEHGVGPDSRLLAAMGSLLRVLEGEDRIWASRRVDVILGSPRRQPVPMRDLPRLKARLAALRAEANGSPPPPSGPRSAKAWIAEGIALRWAATDALGALTGDMGAGCYRLGGVQLCDAGARGGGAGACAARQGCGGSGAAQGAGELRRTGRCGVSRISFVSAIKCDWAEVEEQVQTEIDQREADGWELHQIAGPAFSQGTHVILVFQKEVSDVAPSQRASS